MVVLGSNMNQSFRLYTILLYIEDCKSSILMVWSCILHGGKLTNCGGIFNVWFRSNLGLPYSFIIFLLFSFIQTIGLNKK